MVLPTAKGKRADGKAKMGAVESLHCDFLNHLPWVADDEGEGVALLLAVNREGEDEVLAILNHLKFPAPTPLFEAVFTNDGGATIDTHTKAVAAVGGDRPEGNGRDAEGDGIGIGGNVESQVDVGRGEAGWCILRIDQVRHVPEGLSGPLLQLRYR